MTPSDLPGPTSTPPPGNGVIHLWRFDLDAEAPSAAAMVLNDAERARASRFVFAHHRARYIAGRAALRRTLARYLGAGACDIPLVVSNGGKPALGLEPPPVVFNYSRSGAIGVLAVAAAGRLGVDIEAIEARPDLPAVAARNFSPEERQFLAGVTGDRWLAAFFRCWTLKEAVMKATGDGLIDDLATVSFLIDPEAEPRLLSTQEPYAPGAWCFRCLDAAAGVPCAIAFESPVTGIEWK